ncbi:MAG: hypothetical protein V1779_00165 [bacterium]
MKNIPKIVRIFIFLWFLSSITNTVFAQKEKCVVICQGRYAKVYHSSANCRGLNNCRGGVITVTLKEALNMGRRPCKVCGGNPFYCETGKSKVNEDYCEKKLSYLENKYEGKIESLNNYILQLKNDNVQLTHFCDSLKKINIALNSPYKNRDTFLISVYNYIELKKEFDEKQINLDKLYLELKNERKYLDKQKTELSIQKEEINEKKESLKSAESNFEMRYNNAQQTLKTAESLQNMIDKKLSEINEKEDDISVLKKNYETKKGELNNFENSLKRREQRLKKDIENAEHIYPERFALDLMGNVSYFVDMEPSANSAIDLTLSLFYRFDINKDIDNKDERVNKVGFSYTFKSLVETETISNFGYFQTINLNFGFKEFFRIGIGYSYLPSKINQQMIKIVNLPVTFMITRSPFLIGIKTSINFNEKMYYLYTDIGLSIGIGFDFLRL